MFERFTERARKAVVLGQDEAKRLRHAYIGTEHLLLGLLREEEGVAAQALGASGVTLDDVRGQVEDIVGYGDDVPGEQAPFTQHAKAALELSLGEALQLRHNYIGTEHLLLGLLREDGELTRTILGNLGIESGEIREQILRRLGRGRGPRPQPRKEPGPMAWTRDVLRRAFGRSPRGGQSLFDKFTDSGRRIMVLVQDEARHFNHNYIGTEHLLLGLLRDDEGIGARALGALGVHLDEAREQVESIVGYGEEGTGTRAPFTPRSKKVLQLAEREALQLDDDHVGSEHVLLGLVRESEGVAARVLSDLDVDPDAVRREVIRRLPDRRIEPDSLDLIERELEEEERGFRLFRGRVAGVRAELDVPRPLPVTVDVDYAYRAPEGRLEGSPAVELGDVLDLLRGALGETRARSVEAVIAMLGERLLDAFPAMLEVTVTISGPPEQADPPSPTFSLSATFSR